MPHHPHWKTLTATPWYVSMLIHDYLMTDMAFHFKMLIEKSPDYKNSCYFNIIFPWPVFSFTSSRSSDIPVVSWEMGLSSAVTSQFFLITGHRHFSITGVSPTCIIFVSTMFNICSANARKLIFFRKRLLHLDTFIILPKIFQRKSTITQQIPVLLT